MNFFKRFTSVFFCCILLSSFFVVPVSAVDDYNYYSLPPVGDSESSISSLYPVNPAEFDNNDSTTLTNIYEIIQYLYLSPAFWQSNSVIGFLEKIFDRLPSNLGINFALQGGDGTNSILDDVRKWTMFTYNSLTSDNISGNLGKIQQNTLATADRLLSLVSALGDGGLATESTLKAFADSFSSFAPLNSEWPGDPVSFGSYFNKVFSITSNPALIGDTSTDYNKGFIFNVWANPVDDSISSRFDAHFSWSGLLSTLLSNFIYDGNKSSYAGGGPTIYRMLHLLQDTLASEDDRQLADNYKENREQAEKDFLSGKSDKTSLGKDDFGSLSGVGGTFKDITSLNGQASIGSFTDGLSSANETGQGWFSQATKDALDSVSESSSNVSTFSVEGDYMEDTDIYNMSGFEEHYAWLWGD